MKFFLLPVVTSFIIAVGFSLFVSCSSSSVREEVATLTVKDASKRGRGISIETVDADVTIVGDLAETTLDLVIRNSTSEVMEASLDLPLPEGATISRYALDVDGTMREGVIVDKEQGRKAFENTIRQKIDPGLLEKTSGNNFRTRIYPVPANGTKRVLLSYTEPLKLDSQGNYQYLLPLEVKQRVRKFNLRMIANHGRTQIIPRQDSSGFSAQKDGDALRMTAVNTGLSVMKFAIPATTDPQVMVQRGNDGARYFYLSQAHPKSVKYKRPTVSKLKLIWDTSHSSRLRDREKDLQLLDRYFSVNKNVTVDLTFLSLGVSKTSQHRVENGSWEQLRMTLANVLYDGASSMRNLSLTDSNYGAIMYFGDGISTFDNGSQHTVKAGNAPVYLINSSPQANHALLQNLADESGGAYVNLYSTSQDLALDEILAESYRLIKVTGNGVSQLKLSSSNQVSSFSGKFSNSSTVLKLHYGVRGKILDVVDVSVSRQRHAIGGTMAAKMWAQRQINTYAANPKKHRSTIVSIAKTHHLVTDFTSLIVLDRVSDYVRYRIIPPTDALRKRYHEQLKYMGENRQGKPADLDHVYREWQTMVRWHKVGFPLAKNISRYNFKEIKPYSFMGGGKVSPVPGRNAADFISPINGAFIDGIPSGVSRNVLNIITVGNRSGDFTITRDSIDSFLNNPEPNFRRAKPQSASIAIKGWTPKTRYAKSLNAAAKRGGLVQEYARWKTKYQSTPGFYLDAAEVFLRNEQRGMAIQVLSNLAEIDSESAEMLRVLAFRYSQMGEYALAEMLLREVVEMCGEEPQSYRDLALVLAKRQRYSEASTLLWKVVNTTWDNRFYGIKMIVINEWNQIQNHTNKKLSSAQRRFRYNIDADVRVVIDWDTDNSDMDLWVTTPDGEKCYYSNRLTKLGGKMSQDLTEGRGPEEFMIRRASEGEYNIQANYYGTREQTLAGPTTLRARVITNWNRPNQQEKVLTFKLGKAKQVIDIGEAGYR